MKSFCVVRFHTAGCPRSTTRPALLGQPAPRAVLLMPKELVPLAPSLVLHLLYCAISEQMK